MNQSTHQFVSDIEQFVKDELGKLESYENKESAYIHAYGVLAGVEVQLRILRQSMEPNPFEGCDETPEALEEAA
jgi:hypothetical protein